MPSKNEMKYYASLKQKKQRVSKKLFLVEGLKQTKEALASDWKCELILYTLEFRNSSGDFFEKLDTSIRIEHVTENDLERIADAKSPQGIIAIFHQKELQFSENHSKQIVVLENISDPGNLGTIIRTCDWFGFNRIVLDAHCADIYNPKVVRSTMGSLFHVDLFQVEDLSGFFVKMKNDGFYIKVADLNGISYKQSKAKEKSLIVFCSESHGPSGELLKIADEQVTIAKYGNSESLNVASAAAVILSEFAHNNKSS